jgi:DNA invertase Pin-like site-specific DNA recombinase
MFIGYTRFVDDDKTQRKQTRALKAAGCKTIAKEKQINGSEVGIPLGDVKKGDTLVVWRLDCLTNTLKELIEILSELSRRKASFKSLSEDFTVTPRSAGTMLATLGTISDFQSSYIRQRTIHGLREARAQGRVGGRPRKLGPVQVKKAKTMLKKPNMTKSQVAAHFGVCRATLNQALTG